MTSSQLQWLLATAKSAEIAEHIFPQMAACEAALESNYGQSALAREANNLFGMKAHSNSTETVSLPTHEFLDDSWVVVDAEWMKYETLDDCFEDRMATLKRLAPKYPHYANALVAPDPFQYVAQVSLTWSTDPQRASKCTEIYNAFMAAPKPEGWPNE
jgi:flagellum-specific peptidoglycan hydrolase FlgJ